MDTNKTPNQPSNPIKINLMWVGLGLAIIGLIFLVSAFVNGISSYRAGVVKKDYEQQLKELQSKTSSIMDKYEVEKTEQCRVEVANVMTYRQEVNDMQKELKKKQDFKNNICGSLKNMPEDVKNPYDYYQVVKTSSGYMIREKAYTKNQDPVTELEFGPDDLTITE